MNYIGELTADGYGLFLFATDIFNDYINKKKCRVKKMITFMNKNKEFFFDPIKAGVLIPFYKLSCFEYNVFINIDEEVEIPENFEVVYKKEGFYAHVGLLSRLCISSFDFLEYGFDKMKQNIMTYTFLILKNAENEYVP